MRCHCGHTKRAHVARFLGQEARQATTLCLGCADDPETHRVCVNYFDNAPEPDSVARGAALVQAMQEFGARRGGYYGAQSAEIDPEEREDLLAYIDTLETTCEKARTAVLEWLDKQSHERCWYYPDLFSRLVEILDVRAAVAADLPPRAEFEAGCAHFQEEQYGKAEQDGA